MRRPPRSTTSIAVLIGIASIVLLGVQTVGALEVTNGAWSDLVGGVPGPVDPRTDAVPTRIETSRSTTSASGVSVTVSVSGANVAMLTTTEPMSKRGGTVDLFAEPAIADAVGVVVTTEVQGCDYGVQVDTRCEGRGTMRIEFSQEITDPVLSIAGLGAGGWETRNSTAIAQTSMWTELTILTPGITLRPIGTTTNLSVTGDGTRVSPTVANPSSSCTNNASNYGATDTAVCGSLVLVGTAKVFEFAVTLGTHNVVASCFTARCGLYRDEWSMVVSFDKDARPPTTEPTDAASTSTDEGSTPTGVVLVVALVAVAILATLVLLWVRRRRNR